MAHHYPGPDTRDRAVSAIRDLLNAWDPIGVVDLVHDEYDCLIAPILDQLDEGADAPRLARFLRHELEHHFGLDPRNGLAGIGPVARGAVELRRGAQGS